MNDKNLYTLEDIIAESSFIDWVKNDCRGDSYWSERLNAEPALINPAITQVKSFQFIEEIDVDAKQKQIWSKIDGDITAKKISSVRTKTNRRTVVYMLGAAAAACLLALFMFLPSNNNSYQTIVANEGNIGAELPGRSVVTIRKGSSVSFDEGDWTNNRLVYLNGEAFFNVKKGEKFTVETENAIVEVLGTSFNIQENENSTEVICKTGKVKVKSKLSEDFEIITPNQSVLVNSADVVKTEHQYPLYVPWREVSFIYKDAQLRSVADDLEQAFGVNINLQNIDMPNYNGSFEKKTLEMALDNIKYVMGLDYTIDNKQVTIYKK